MILTKCEQITTPSPQKHIQTLFAADVGITVKVL